MNDRRHVRHLQAAQERDLPGRHAGHRQGREMVARPRRHGRRLPDLPDEGRLAGEARAVRGRRRPHVPRRLPAQGPAHHTRPRGDRAVRHQLRAGEEERDRERSLGPRIYQAEHRRRRRLQGREVDRRHRGRSSSATTTGRAGRCPRSSASSGAWCPSAGNRRALLERGDADISYDLPNKDFAELKDAGQAHASSRRPTATASSISA